MSGCVGFDNWCNVAITAGVALHALFSNVMKLDVNSLRYLSKDEWRVLGSVELGQKNVSFALTFALDAGLNLRESPI